MPRNAENYAEWRRTNYLKEKERYHIDPEYRARKLEACRKWNRANLKRSNAVSYRLRARRRAFVDKLKADAGCKLCRESDPRCLDFHHRDPGQKEMVPALMAPRGLSEDKILAEVAKCDVLCSNCHRKHHADEREKKRALRAD